MIKKTCDKSLDAAYKEELKPYRDRISVQYLKQELFRARDDCDYQIDKLDRLGNTPKKGDKMLKYEKLNIILILIMNRERWEMLTQLDFVRRIARFIVRSPSKI